MIYTFDEQERHPALLREPDMMDTPPIQMFIKRMSDYIVLFLDDYGIISYEVVPLFLLNLRVGFDKDDYWTDSPSIAMGNYNLWRLMIDQKYQNKGYGKKAIEKAIEFVKSFPNGASEYCWLSYEPDNEVAANL